jgi:hypothetical protein
MARWVSDPVNVLARLEVLVSEYPFLCGRGAVLPVLLAFVAPLASAGRGSRAWDAAFQTAICGCYVALLLSMHLFDLARRRVETKAGARGVAVRRDCCFTSPELQEAFEGWRLKGPFWRLLDWATVAYVAAYMVKLARLRSVCGPLHLIWALGSFISSASRALCLHSLSPRGHSLLSLTGFSYIWVTRSMMLVSGDECVVASVGRQMYSGSVAAGVFMSILLYVAAHLLNPVSQAFIPWKMTSGVVGYTLVGYLHILRREDGIDWEVDKERWGLLMLVIGQVITSLAILHVGTLVCEASMHSFLSGQPAAATRMERRTAGR